MSASIEIKGRQIGPGRSVYIVAELSANHAHSFEHAARAIHVAKEIGADAVKLQTYTPDTLTIRSDNDEFRISGGTPWDGQLLYDLYNTSYMPWEWQPRLKAVADEINIDLFSTAYDFSAVDFLEKMGVPVHKIASFEMVDFPLIEKMAGTGKPLIISTGMATLAEIKEAVQVARESGARQIALLKCTSAYPAAPDEINLRTLPHFRETFGVPVGLSDHTVGLAVPVAGVALGACIIEKHFTLSRDIPSPDRSFSLDPQEFKMMVEAIRIAEKALGKVQYAPSRREAESRILRRSLFVVQDMQAGEMFTQENVRSIRPGSGLHTRYFGEILGRRASKNIPRGTPLDWDLLA